MPLQISPQLEKFYRESPMREGILNWYPFTSGSIALDLSGGILTHLLMDKNVKTINADSEECQAGLFDYVVCLDPGEITTELLTNYRMYLNPHGRLLMAFENPYGLQYFSGKRNLRTNLPYQFWVGESKNEVQERLKLAGFKGQKWYYPFSNHYFTREIYSDNYMPNEFLNHRGHELIEDDYTKVFDERPLWKEIIRGGAFGFLCNSYLVEVRINESDEPCNVDFAAITAYRERDKAFITTVHSDGTACKQAIFDEGKPGLFNIAQNHKDLQRLGVNVLPVQIKEGRLFMERIELPTLWDNWTKKLLCGGLDEKTLFKHFDKIRDAIYSSSKEGRCYWELVPANCFFNESSDEIIFFDQEYYWDSIDPDMVLVRSIYALKYSIEFQKHEKTQYWIEALKNRYNLTEKWDDLAELADNKTWAFVFNPNQTRPLEKAIERAYNRTTEQIAVRMAEAERYIRMSEVVEVLIRNGFRKPCIYGYGIRGKMLRYALEMFNIDVACIVDRQSPNVFGIPVFESVQSISNISIPDVIIVTPIKGAEAIASELRKLVSYRVVTIEELLNEQN